MKDFYKSVNSELTFANYFFSSGNDPDRFIDSLNNYSIVIIYSNEGMGGTHLLNAIRNYDEGKYGNTIQTDVHLLMQEIHTYRFEKEREMLNSTFLFIDDFHYLVRSWYSVFSRFMEFLERFIKNNGSLVICTKPIRLIDNFRKEALGHGLKEVFLNNIDKKVIKQILDDEYADLFNEPAIVKEVTQLLPNLNYNNYRAFHATLREVCFKIVEGNDTITPAILLEIFNKYNP